jgi:hypothetical protein
MDIQIAKKKLEDSLSNLKRIKGQLSTSDIEADIMNVACLELLKENDSWIKKGADNDSIMAVMYLNHMRYSEDVELYFEAASLLYPSIYKNPNKDIFVGLVIKNATWSGMWDFLKKYFKDNHNKNI